MASRKNIQTARRLDTAQPTERPSVVPAAIKKQFGLPEKIFGLVGTQDTSQICKFITDPQISKEQRLHIIKKIPDITLIPSTYELVQRTLLRMSRDDPHPEIKAASQSTFIANREKLGVLLKKVV